MTSRAKSRVAVVAALLTATFFLLSVDLAQAQSTKARATIPFAFYWGEGMLPAGNYDVTSFEYGGILRLTNRDTRTSAVFNTISVSRLASEANPKLIFHRYGDDYFLAEMWWGGRSDGRKLLPSKAERELARGGSPARIVSVAVR